MAEEDKNHTPESLKINQDNIISHKYISRSEVSEASKKLNLFIENNWDTEYVITKHIPNTNIKIERVFQEDHHNWSLNIYDKDKEVAWIIINNNGKIEGTGRNPEKIIEISKLI